MKTENMYLAQRVQELVDEYNNVAHQLIGKQKRKNKDSSKPEIDEMQQMREHCDHPESKNNGLDRFVKAMHEFVIDKNLYMKNGTSCGYTQGYNTVCSTYCLGCNSCLSVIKGHGVICEKRLAEANVSILSL